MNVTKTLLTGISASALLAASSASVLAQNGPNVILPPILLQDHDNDVIDDVTGNSDDNDQDIDIGEDNDGNGFNNSNAVAVAALQQSAVQIVASDNQDAIDDDYEADMDFGEQTFQNQLLNNNNFNTGVNAVQGNALAVAGSSAQTIDPD